MHFFVINTIFRLICEKFPYINIDNFNILSSTTSNRVVKMSKSYGVPLVFVAKFNGEKESMAGFAEKSPFRWRQEPFQNGRRSA